MINQLVALVDIHSPSYTVGLCRSAGCPTKTLLWCHLLGFFNKSSGH